MTYKQKSTLYFWIIFSFALLLLNIYCLRINLNADSLFPFRYIASLLSENPNKIIIQPGSRIFPEWIYSLIAYKISQDPMIWSRIVIFIHTLLLGLSFKYLFTQMGFEKPKILLYTIVGLLIIPILNLLHLNVLIYFVNSPGLHGFFLPYLIICLGIFFSFYTKRIINKLHGTLFVILAALMISSNLNFVVAFSAPTLAMILVLFLLNRIELNTAIKIMSLIFLSIALGMIISNLLENLDQFIFLKNHFSFFTVSFMEWLTNNNLVDRIFTRKVAGYFMEIFLISLMFSVYTLFRLNKEKSSNLYVLNAINLIWPVVFISSLWVINLQSIRLMPYIFLFSPIVLVINVHQITFNNNKVWLIIIFFLSITSTVLYYDNERPYIQYQKIENTIINLKKENIIKGDGLSDYWISNALYINDIDILPINTNGEAALFAIDGYKFWNWNEDIKTQRSFGFIINRKNINAKKWILDESKLKNYFGEWQETVIKQFDNKTYKIYIYKDLVNTSNFYPQLNINIQSLMEL